MTKPKPKALGTSVEVPEGAQVVPPGGTSADPRTITEQTDDTEPPRA